MLYRRMLKPLLFRMDPERAHHLIIDSMQFAQRLPGSAKLFHAMYGVAPAPELSTRLWGIDFASPIGLAAGLDKDAAAAGMLSAIGFGFVEVGTVTPLPQPGNEQPRLFRLPKDQALINRMGFNNQGAQQMCRNLQAVRRRTVPIAINIGKNKVTANEQAAADYQACIQQLYTYGDLFVVNISSPNTPDLRNLQHGEQLADLLRAVMEEMDRQQAKCKKTEKLEKAEKLEEAGKSEASRSEAAKLEAVRPESREPEAAKPEAAKPVLVKLAPDLSEQELEQIVETIMQSGVSGVIATNTTLSRDGLIHGNANESGGLSGEPLRERSTEFIRQLYRFTEGKLPIVGVGGVFTAQHAYDKIRAGASLVEVYTGLIYKGPGINRQINRGLLECLKKDGFTHISQAVGADFK